MNACYERCIPKKFLMSEKQLSHLIKLLPITRKKQGRPAVNMRVTLQGIFYLLKTGCQYYIRANWNGNRKKF